MVTEATALVASPSASVPKKPQRPLTAYHIFFQIEREFIIQTTAGEDADKSIHDNKATMADVPRRYRDIKLMPDWYASPGKRTKRKHRKQHGKIGFLELSRLISSRWAQLPRTDPETKAFVQRIAKLELEEYKLEMKVYKELIAAIMPPQVVEKPVEFSDVPKKKAKQSHDPYVLMQQRPRFVAPPPQQESVPSLCQAVNFMLKTDIDYFLKSIDTNATQQSPSLVSPRPSLLGSSTTDTLQVQRKRKMYQRKDSGLSVSQFDPLVEVSSGFVGASSNIEMQQRRVSTDHSYKNVVEVDLCDDEIMKLGISSQD